MSRLATRAEAALASFLERTRDKRAEEERDRREGDRRCPNSHMHLALVARDNRDRCPACAMEADRIRSAAGQSPEERRRAQRRQP